MLLMLSQLKVYNIGNIRNLFSIFKLRIGKNISFKGIFFVELKINQ